MMIQEIQEVNSADNDTLFRWKYPFLMLYTRGVPNKVGTCIKKAICYLHHFAYGVAKYNFAIICIAYLNGQLITIN